MKKLEEFGPSERPLLCCLTHCLGIVIQDVKHQMTCGVPYASVTLDHRSYERIVNALVIQLMETMQGTTDEIMDLASQTGEAGELAEFLIQIFGKETAKQMMQDILTGKVPPMIPPVPPDFSSPDGPPAPGLDDVPPLFRSALD